LDGGQGNFSSAHLGYFKTAIEAAVAYAKHIEALRNGTTPEACALTSRNAQSSEPAVKVEAAEEGVAAETGVAGGTKAKRAKKAKKVVDHASDGQAPPPPLVTDAPPSPLLTLTTAVAEVDAKAETMAEVAEEAKLKAAEEAEAAEVEAAEEAEAAQEVETTEVKVAARKVEAAAGKVESATVFDMETAQVSEAAEPMTKDAVADAMAETAQAEKRAWKGSCNRTDGCVRELRHRGRCKIARFDDVEYEVEAILDERGGPPNGFELLVKWRGWPLEDSTWEPEANLASAPAVLAAWHAHHS